MTLGSVLSPLALFLEKEETFRLPIDRRAKTRQEMALVVATPHPDLDIHTLFSYYNSIYFDNTLSSCFVEWSSPRLISCSATCNYLKGYCQITLSQPLLRYLSADHVKNTLLHEMIHAFLFVTKNYRNHGTHGPEFRNFMNSINSSTKADSQRPPFGYKITLFHGFHDEDVVDDNIAHCWMCAKCGDTIKRATTTRPSHADCIVQAHHAKKTCGLADCRWHRHKVKCGGIYSEIQKLDEHHDKKKVVSNGSIRLLDEESLKNTIPEKKGKSVPSNDKFIPCSAKANSSATLPCLTYQRNLKETSGSKLGSSGINIKNNIQGSLSLIDWKSPEANMSDKNGKSVTELNKEITRFEPSSANSHKISQPRIPRNVVPQERQEHVSPTAEESSTRRKLGAQLDQILNLRGLSSPTVKNPSEGNISEKGKPPQVTVIKKEVASNQAARYLPCSAKVVPLEKPQRSTRDREVLLRKAKNRCPEMEKAYEKPKASKKETTREITGFFPSQASSHTGSSSMKVVPHRKPEFSPPNKESCRKRKHTRKEFISQDSKYKVVSKWLEYYEDESTDEEIEPLVNRKTIRNKRMKILKESIKREKEEKERKHKEEMETKLLCLPGFPQGNVLEISDDDSS
ncbi:uncharacterized protein LOC144574041 isoform X2 [Carex rostrata]